MRCWTSLVEEGQHGSNGNALRREGVMIKFSVGQRTLMKQDYKVRERQNLLPRRDCSSRHLGNGYLSRKLGLVGGYGTAPDTARAYGRRGR